jgi:hypothetical protein
MDRRRFLQFGGAATLGAVLVGTRTSSAAAKTSGSLKSQFDLAAKEYKVPVALLLAMGYVNTTWEMPPPSASPYRNGDIHGRGAYGIMQLLQNPSRDTLARAASLTGLSEEKLKSSRAANVRRGAAVLSDIVGKSKPKDLNGWQYAVADYGDTDLYTIEVYQTLKAGASATISTGEHLVLAPQDVEVPQIFIAQGKADSRSAVWRPAYWNGAKRCVNSYNYCQASRGAAQINFIVVHTAQGSYSGTLGWFQDPRAKVSVHYVVGKRGEVAQCLHNADIAYHAGNWWYNKHSIGIELEGYASQRKTDREYRASAKLAAYLVRRFDIPSDGQHIIPHRRIVATRCPGKFEFDRYLRLIRRFR